MAIQIEHCTFRHRSGDVCRYGIPGWSVKSASAGLYRDGHRLVVLNGHRVDHAAEPQSYRRKSESSIQTLLYRR